MIDTAGRLQNRTDLMEELAKIVKGFEKKGSEAPQNTILVWMQLLVRMQFLRLRLFVK